MKKYIYFMILAVISVIVLLYDFRFWQVVIVLDLFAILGYMRTRHLVENGEKAAEQIKEKNK